MSEVKFDIIKKINNNETIYINLQQFLNEITSGNYQAYYYNDEKSISAFTKIINIDIIVTDDTSILQKSFNPLKKHLPQDLIILSKDMNIRIEVPYMFAHLYEQLPEINVLYKKCDSDRSKFIYENLMKYAFTKNLEYFNNIIKMGYQLNSTVFKYLKTFTDSMQANFSDIEILVNLLNTGEVNTIYSTNNTWNNILLERKKEEECKISKLKNELSLQKNNKKNIILFHLESISTDIYTNHIDKLPTINSLMAKSLRLKNFYTSATSSIMAVSDLFFGNDFEYDHFVEYQKMFVEPKYSEHLYNILKHNGYNTFGISYHDNIVTQSVNKQNLWAGQDQEYILTPDYEDFIGNITDFIDNTTNQPFALHIWNCVSHLTINDDYINEGMNIVDRMNLSYASADETIKTVLDTLEKNNLLEDTIIIGYGDHGDDLFSRRINEGHTHVTEPYLNIIKNIAFIYDKRIEPFMFNNIVSMIDLKNTILFLLGLPQDNKFEYSGLNIFESQNKYVYAKNFFANQREIEPLVSEWSIRMRRSSNKMFRNKSFSIVNKNYCLSVSKHGMEFYIHHIDSFGHSNILNFFIFDDNGEIIGFDNHGAWLIAFRSTLMCDSSIFDIMENFYDMRKALQNRLITKYELIDSDNLNMFDFDNFKKVRDRNFAWEPENGAI